MRAIIGPMIFCFLMLPVQALAQLEPSSMISRMTPEKYISIIKNNGFTAKKFGDDSIELKVEGLTYYVSFSNCEEDGCTSYTIAAIYSSNFSNLQKVNDLNNSWRFMKFSILGDDKKLVFQMEIPIRGGVSERSFSYNLVLFDQVTRAVARDLG